jgi:proteasome beta subunit
MDSELNKNILKTGTSILGLVCKDGVVIAADRQTTGGDIVVHKNSRKVEQINDYLVIAVCGGAADSKMMKKLINAELKLKQLKSKKRPTIREAANLVGMIAYKNIRQPSMLPFVVGLLVGGFNEDGTVVLYSIEPAGGVYEVEDYDANFGSGMPFILGLLERQYKKGLTIEQGVELAVESIKSSTQRDVASGHGIDVISITKDGIKKAFEKELKAEVR